MKHKGESSGSAKDPAEELLDWLHLHEEGVEEFVWEDEITDPSRKPSGWQLLRYILREGLALARCLRI